MNLPRPCHDPLTTTTPATILRPCLERLRIRSGSRAVIEYHSEGTPPGHLDTLEIARCYREIVPRFITLEPDEFSDLHHMPSRARLTWIKRKSRVPTTQWMNELGLVAFCIQSARIS